MKFRLIMLTAALMLLFGMQANAEDVREVTWDDLVPAELDFDDPFEKLTEDQLYNLALIARYREQKESKAKTPDFTSAEYDEATSKLKEDNIDIEGLLARREEITEKRRLRGQTANTKLDGKNIRIPGYLLPLEFKEKKVTEFLLVPWVGACIHTPPPPPNQIVHVKLQEGFDLGDDIFTPVWVNGVMKAENNNPELSFVDGKQNIDVSYVLQADEVKPYEE
ncbi:MAG: DUF3299 domain-containing protein [Thiotrichales bacterium]|nr:MAG: DUF3299 domain-containing protein [Thiotrichales bacterium]